MVLEIDYCSRGIWREEIPYTAAGAMIRSQSNPTSAKQSADLQRCRRLADPASDANVRPSGRLNLLGNLTEVQRPSVHACPRSPPAVDSAQCEGKKRDKGRIAVSQQP